MTPRDTPPAGWEGLLDEDEDILWQGRPDGRFAWTRISKVGLPFGMVFAGFALFWMWLAYSPGIGFWMLGLFHFTAGLIIIALALFGGPFLNRRTWYTLTNKRAFIAMKWPFFGRQLSSYPITAETVLTLHDGDVPSVYFAKKRRKTKRGHTYDDVGFARIADAIEVMALIRDIQSKARR